MDATKDIPVEQFDDDFTAQCFLIACLIFFLITSFALAMM